MLYPTILVGLLMGGVLTYTVYNYQKKIDEAVYTAKEAKALLNVQKKMNLSSKYKSKKVVTSPMNIDNVKLSELAIGESPKDRNLLDKLQAATIEAVVEEHIDNPTCDDLAKTGKITKEECNYIAKKKQNYAQIQNGNIVIKDKGNKSKKIAKSLVALMGAKNIKKEDKQTIIQNVNLSLKQKTEEIKKSEKILREASDIVKNTDDPKLIASVTEKVVQFTPKYPGKAIETIKNIENVPDRKRRKEKAKKYSEIKKAEEIKKIKEKVSEVKEKVKDYIENVEKINKLTDSSSIISKTKTPTKEKEASNDVEKNKLEDIKKTFITIEEKKDELTKFRFFTK
jgi:hypothetical protein